MNCDSAGVPDSGTTVTGALNSEAVVPDIVVAGLLESMALVTALLDSGTTVSGPLDSGVVDPDILVADVLAIELTVPGMNLVVTASVTHDSSVHS